MIFLKNCKITGSSRCDIDSARNSAVRAIARRWKKNFILGPDLELRTTCLFVIFSSFIFFLGCIVSDQCSYKIRLILILFIISSSSTAL